MPEFRVTATVDVFADDEQHAFDLVYVAVHPLDPSHPDIEVERCNVGRIRDLQVP